LKSAIARFLSTAQDTAAQLHVAVARRDAESATSTAQRLRKQASIFEASTLVAALFEVDALIVDAEWAGVDRALARVQRALDDVMQELTG
jgi:hypothetical protein